MTEGGGFSVFLVALEHRGAAGRLSGFTLVFSWAPLRGRQRLRLWGWQIFFLDLPE